MFKKKRAKRRERPYQPRVLSRHRSKAVVIIGLILCLGLTSLILAGWRDIRNSFSPLVPVPAPTPSLSALNPSKEYIYAGGKLVATEEPSNGSGSATPLI